MKLFKLSRAPCKTSISINKNQEIEFFGSHAVSVCMYYMHSSKTHLLAPFDNYIHQYIRKLTMHNTAKRSAFTWASFLRLFDALELSGDH